MNNSRQLFFGLTLFVQVNLIVLTFICRDALFVSKFGQEHRAEYSAAAVLLSSIVSTPAFTLASRMAKSLGPSSLGAVVAALCSCSFILFYTSLEYSQVLVEVSRRTGLGVENITSTLVEPHFLCGFFYVWSDVCVMLIMNNFWELCNSSFKITETKAAFGNINLGNTVANLFVGFLFSPLLEHFQITTTGRLLIMATLSMLLSLLLFSAQFLFSSTMNQLHKLQLEQQEKQKEMQRGHMLGGKSVREESLPISKILSRSYYRHICLFEFCATALRVFVDLQTMNVMASSLGEGIFESKLALIKGVSAVLMIPMQLGTGTILSSVGVMYGLSTLPLATWLFGLGTTILPSVTAVIVLRSLHDATGYTLFTTSRELLFLPLTPRERRAIKPLVTGVVRSIAKAFGAILSILLKRTFQSMNTSSSYTLGIMIVTISTVWLADVLSARRAYAGEFYQLLQTMTSRGTALLSDRADVRAFDMADPKVLAAVHKTLKSGSPIQQIFIFDSLPLHSVKQFRPELYGLMTGRVHRAAPSLSGKATLKSTNYSFDLTRESAPTSQQEVYQGVSGSKEGPRNFEAGKEKGVLVAKAASPKRQLRRFRSSMHIPPNTLLNPTTTQGSPASEKTNETNEMMTNRVPAAVQFANTAISAPNSPRNLRSHSVSGLSNIILSDACELALSSPKVSRLPVSPSQLTRKRSNKSMDSDRPVDLGRSEETNEPELSLAIRKKALQILCKAQLTSSDDLLILVCNPHLNRELRTEAVRACGIFKYDSPQLRRKLEELISIAASGFEGLRIMAAISLLRITDWQHTKAHVAVYKMMHNESTLQARIVALSFVGNELPELISDGYLAYLLHTSPSGSMLLESAVRCCNRRRSTILLPQLIEKLSDLSLQNLVVSALLSYEPSTVLAFAKPALNSAISKVITSESVDALDSALSIIRGWTQWMFKSVNQETKHEYFEMILNVTDLAVENISSCWGKGTQNLFQKSRVISALEPLIDFLLHEGSGPSAPASVRTRISSIFLPPSLTKKDNSTSSLLQIVLDIIVFGLKELKAEGSKITHTFRVVRLGAQLRHNIRILLKLCAIRFFPGSLSVDLIFEAFISTDTNHSTAASEVVENLLQGEWRKLVLPTIKQWIELDTKMLRPSQEILDDQDGWRVSNETAITSLSDLETFRVLMQSSLFQNITLHDLQSVVESGHCISQRFEAAGTVFARAGENEAEIYIVACGTVTVFVPGYEQHDFAHEAVDNFASTAAATLRQGDCIGNYRLSALFYTDLDSNSSSMQLKRVTSARASTDCILLVVSVKKFAVLLQKSPTMLRGVLSVLLLDLRRCFLFRLIRIRRNVKMKNAVSSSVGSERGEARTPLSQPSANIHDFDEGKALQKRFSKLSTNSNGALLTTNQRSSGTRSSRLSMLELCICLKDARAFKFLDMDTIRALAEISEQRVYASGDVIFAEGGQSSFLFLVVEGSCHLYSSIVGNGDRVVGRIGNGSISGELALIPQSSRLVTCKVAGQSTRGEVLVIAFESSSLLKLMANNNSISKAITQHVLWQLDKEYERSEKGESSSKLKHGLDPKVRQHVVSPAWDKIRQSVVSLPHNFGLRRRFVGRKINESEM